MSGRRDTSRPDCSHFLAGPILEIVMRKNSHLRSTALGLLLLIAVPVLASPSNKWRIQLSGYAKVTGEIELAFTPRDGTATNVVIAVPQRTSENQAAAMIRDALRAQFGKDVYRTEVDDGEDVLVKARGSTPDFDLVVVRNTAEGLRISLDKE
jgi:hypothetical protein